MLNDIKIAPSTTLKNLSFNPFERQPSVPGSTGFETRSGIVGLNSNEVDEGEERVMTAEDARIWAELFDKTPSDTAAVPMRLDEGAAQGRSTGHVPAGSSDSVDVGAADGEIETESGWFVTLWSALEDLFDYDSIMSFNERTGALTPSRTQGDKDGSSDGAWGGEDSGEEDEGGNEDDDEVGSRHGNGVTRGALGGDSYISTSALANSRAIRQMLYTGIACAEDIVFALFRRFSDNERDKYNRIKNRLISRASIGRSGGVASLTSTQWSFIGLILVDNIARRVYSRETVCSRFGEEWSRAVHSAADRILLGPRGSLGTGIGASDSGVFPTSSRISSRAGAGVSRGCLDDSEIDILRNFFEG
jgi:hypothetical protein